MSINKWKKKKTFYRKKKLFRNNKKTHQRICQKGLPRVRALQFGKYIGSFCNNFQRFEVWAFHLLANINLGSEWETKQSKTKIDESESEQKNHRHSNSTSILKWINALNIYRYVSIRP